MVTLKFYTLQDRIPSNGEEIVYLRSTSSFGYFGFEPKETTAEYCWFGYDGQGIHTGDQIGYDPDIDSNFKIGATFVDEDDPHVYWKLEVLFDEWCVTDFNGNSRGFLWVPVDEYWDSFRPLNLQLEESNE